LGTRYPKPKYRRLELPIEVEATQANLDEWLQNMLVYHCFTLAEAAQVCGLNEREVRERASRLGSTKRKVSRSSIPKQVLVLPYPGGRHPRRGFLEGAYDPMRGTKASIFLPWDSKSYVVVDLPEAIFSNLGLIFLAHTHIPTVWNDQNEVLENVDWEASTSNGLSFRRTLPNGIVFGASVQPEEQGVRMELWLRNVTDRDLTGLVSQVCVLLKGAVEFNDQSNDNKLLKKSVAAVRSQKNRDKWILTAWQHCDRVWANPPCPCMHSDPRLPDCPSGQTVRVTGRLWFYEGSDIEREIGQAQYLLA
jgi:hypothetical protein